MEVYEGLLAFGAEEEGAVGGVVHEEIFGEDGRADGVAENVEVFFPVTVAVGGISADAFAVSIRRSAYCSLALAGLPLQKIEIS